MPYHSENELNGGLFQYFLCYDELNSTEKFQRHSHYDDDFIIFQENS